MPSRTERLRVARPLHVGGAVLLPIERVVLHAAARRRHGWLCASIDVVAVVACDARGARALGIDGAAIAVDELRVKVPGLDAALRTATGGGPDT